MDPNMNLRLFHRLGAVPALVISLVLAGCGSSSSSSVGNSPSASEASAGTAEEGHPTLAGEPIIDPAVQAVAYTEKVSSRIEPSKPKFDPIAENGKFFEGWAKPRLALVISGSQDGYLEPCGCAGIENQKGGLSRRYSFMQQLRARGWPVAAVDVGGLVRRYGRQAELQFGMAAEALRAMGYGAVGFGPADLRLSAGEIVAAVAGEKPEDSIFISANVSLLGLTPRFRIIEAGGLKLGVTSVLGLTYQQQVNNNEVTITPAAEAIESVKKEFKEELKGCDVKILLANATTEEARDLAKQFPEFDLVVEAGSADIPAAQPEKIPGTKARLIELGHKGMYVIVAGFYDNPLSVRFQRVALDSRFPESKAMKQLMANYQQQLQQLGWPELGVRTVPHPRASKGDPLAGKFASAASCKECHPTAYGIWSKTKHAHATETLVKLDPPRQYDAECISCHATGWNPTEFFPFTSGFESLAATPELAGNSCDNCHGPGAAHVAAEKGRNRAKRDAEREALKLTVGFAQDNVCVKCHDHDNSPEFTKPGKFEKEYWPKVEHKGKK
jgi:hypothetical protein